MDAHETIISLIAAGDDERRERTPHVGKNLTGASGSYITVENVKPHRTERHMLSQDRRVVFSATRVRRSGSGKNRQIIPQQRHLQPRW